LLIRRASSRAFKRSKRRKPKLLLLLVLLALLVGVADYQIARNYGIEAELGHVKAKTAELMRTEQETDLAEPSRLLLPTTVWGVAGSLVQFADCFECPIMRVVPAGEFTMGDPVSDADHEHLHRVRLRLPFAVSKYEITFDEWNQCVIHHGCAGYRPAVGQVGMGTQPVIDVNWTDAQDYVAWLNLLTGKHYRLLSESEWEYAARAGTNSTFSFGDAIGPPQANYSDADGESLADPSQSHPAPVGSYPPNAFGLYDMHGNVWEWVQDCWHEHYTKDAPTDGSAWIEKGCDGHVLRGGSWQDSEKSLRAASRVSGNSETRSHTIGIRIARTL
jgi:formylglycine-generating enzyme required for sulfatase activity